MGQASSTNSTGRDPTRRNFMKGLLGFSILSTLGGVLVPIIGYLIPPKHQGSEKGGRVRVASLAELQAAGGLVVPANNRPVVLTATQGSKVNAYSAICTHLGCVVRWKSAAGYIECPCHDGRFNAQTGAVISGPPPAPLTSLQVIVEGDDVYVIT